MIHYSTKKAYREIDEYNEFCVYEPSIKKINDTLTPFIIQVFTFVDDYIKTITKLPVKITIYGDKLGGADIVISRRGYKRLTINVKSYTEIWILRTELPSFVMSQHQATSPFSEFLYREINWLMDVK